MRLRLIVALLCFAFGARLAAQGRGQQNTTLTAVPGIKVGHYTYTERPTGCTAVIVDGDAVGGVSQKGGAPGTRETDLLDPLNMVDKVNAVVLAGGSAFGLDAATGVVKWLEEHNIGWPAGPAKVPIVPAAILFDLGIGGSTTPRPNADCGYKSGSVGERRRRQEGSVGAGAGATVGKFGGGRSMKAGIGSAAVTLPNGLIVAALVAVNAVGDIIDPSTGKTIAGVRNADGTLADVRKILKSGTNLQAPRPGAEHDHRRRRDQRPALEGRRQPHGADGRRWLRARDLPVSHQRRRRHDFFARDGPLGWYRGRQHRRCAGSRSHGAGGRARRHAGHRRCRHSRRRDPRSRWSLARSYQSLDP